MKYLLILFVFFTISCGGVTDPSKKDSTKHEKYRCIDGVKYVVFKGYSGNQGYGYMSVKFNKDSTVSLCEEN